MTFSNARVMLQRESEIAGICAGGFMCFVVNKMSYFFVSVYFRLFVACNYSYYAYKMIKCIQKVLEVQHI